MGNTNNIPKLRFPEFDKDWSNEDIQSILKIGSGRDYKHLIDGDIPVFGTGGLMTYVNDFLYNGETVCIGRKGTIDKPMYYNGPIWTVDTLFYTHSFKDTLPKFIYFCFLNINWKEYNEASGVPSLSKSTIERINISFPSLPEQQKIASFLTTVDDKISNLKQKVSILEKYKKGVMQQIFSQQIRFKDTSANDYPDWEEKSLGEIVLIQGGFAFKSQLFGKGKNKVLRIGDITNNILNEKFTGVYSSELPNDKYKVSKGDFVIALSGATFGKIGRINDNFEYYINQRVATFRTEQCLNFFFYVMQSHKFIEYIQSIPSTGAQPNISNDDIGRFTFSVPSLEEQTKIAEFLSGIDSKIETTKLQLSKMEVWKKGLLQGMFC